MEILLSINGTRKLPFEVTQRMFDLLQNSNSEVAITLVASPVSRELPADGDAESTGTPIFKVKVVHVASIASTTS